MAWIRLVGCWSHTDRKPWRVTSLFCLHFRSWSLIDTTTIFYPTTADGWNAICAHLVRRTWLVVAAAEASWVLAEACREALCLWTWSNSRGRCASAAYTRQVFPQHCSYAARVCDIRADDAPQWYIIALQCQVSLRLNWNYATATANQTHWKRHPAQLQFLNNNNSTNRFSHTVHHGTCRSFQRLTRIKLVNCDIVVKNNAKIITKLYNTYSW